MLLSLRQYAKSKGVTRAAVYANKKINTIELPVYVKHDGKEYPTGEIQRFVIISK